MEVNITSQAFEALYALLLGAACGVFYDLLSIFRRSVKMKISAILLSALFDSVFCLVCAAGFFMLGFGPGDGKLRFFLILFVVPGGIIYFIFFSRWVTKLLYSLLNLIQLVIQWILSPFIFFNNTKNKLKKSIKNNLRYTRKKYKIEKVYSVKANNGK